MTRVYPAESSCTENMEPALWAGVPYRPWGAERHTQLIAFASSMSEAHSEGVSTGTVDTRRRSGGPNGRGGVSCEGKAMQCHGRVETEPDGAVGEEEGGVACCTSSCHS
eukprot:1125958-Pyramimonas_sp.AAC.1